MKSLAIIPARKGSKRLPGKNKQMLLGKPLIAWTIEQALRCSYFNKIVVSTDCEEIASISKAYGAEVPFLRPESLSQDTSSSVDVAFHVLDYFGEIGENFDNLALLEPTSPLRAKEDLNQAMQAFITHYANYDALVSIGKMEREHPNILKKVENERFLKSYLEKTNSEEAYFPYGVLYATKVASLLSTKTFYPPAILPFKIARWQNFEIDDAIDFACVEKIMEISQDLL